MSVLAISDRATIRLHEAASARDFAPALFSFISQALPQEVLFLVLRPLEFELPSFCSRSEFQPICDSYIAGAHEDDIWLRRSPIRPDVPVVRHSLYTPKAMFHRSRFYRQVMVNIGCEYGASIVAWRQGTWLANLSIFRTEAQGDFLDSEVPILEACHAHFESAVKRIAALRESQLGSHSLETFIWSLPTAALVLDWKLKLLHFNAAAQELVGFWRFGERSTKLKKSRSFVVPGDILASIEKRKEALADIRSNRPGAPSVIPIVEIKHPKTAELSAKVSFLPSKSLAHSKGTFLIALHRYRAGPDERQSYDRFATLTRRERDVVRGASLGKTNGKIATELGTSSNTVRMQLHKAYRKLGVQSRYELMAAFSKSPLLSAPTSPVKVGERS